MTEPQLKNRRSRFNQFLLVAVLSVSFGGAALSTDSLDDLFSPSELRQLWLEPIVPEAGAPPPTPLVLPLNAAMSHGGLVGIDVSHHNTDCSRPGCFCRLDWSQVIRHGIRFAYLKATTGDGTGTKPDPSFATHWTELASYHHQSKLFRGAYHWLSSDARQTGKAQASHFLKVVDVKQAQLVPVVDFEEDPVRRSKEYFETHQDVCKEKKSRRNGQVYYICDGWADISPLEVRNKLQDWLDAVESAQKRKPVIYTRTNYWNRKLGSLGVELARKYSFWLAQYPLPANAWYDRHAANPWRMPPLPPGATYPKRENNYSVAHFWQFSEAGEFQEHIVDCASEKIKGPVDINWFPSGEADFLRELVLRTDVSPISSPKR